MCVLETQDYYFVPTSWGCWAEIILLVIKSGQNVKKNYLYCVIPGLPLLCMHPGFLFL
jgi:hypothetical protein